MKCDSGFRCGLTMRCAAGLALTWCGLEGLQSTVHMGGVNRVHPVHNSPADILQRPLGRLLRPLKEKPHVPLQLVPQPV